MGFNLSGGASGAMSGAGAGAMLGPWGAAGGAVVGGLLGAFGGQDKAPLPVAPNWGAAADRQSMSTRPNTQNALGGQTWTTGPDGRPVSTTAFTGQANDAFQGLLGGMNKSAGIDPTQAGQQAFDRVYSQGASRLDPRWEANQEAFDAKMANQGLSPGMTANINASRTFGEQRNDAYGDLFSRSVGAGQAEQAQARANAMQPFTQAQAMQAMLNDQAPNYGQGTQDLTAAQMKWKADMDRWSAENAGAESKDSGLLAGFSQAVPGIAGMFGPKGGAPAAKAAPLPNTGGGTWV